MTTQRYASYETLDAERDALTNSSSVPGTALRNLAHMQSYGSTQRRVSRAPRTQRAGGAAVPLDCAWPSARGAGLGCCMFSFHFPRCALSPSRAPQLGVAGRALRGR